VAAAQPIKGFFVECLVWNVPNSCFAHETWYEVVSEVLEHLFLSTADLNLCGGWTEVSGYKWLLKNDEQKRMQAANFVAAARKYISA
jgi:hypothetical protein